jgi:hypothetical protein
METKFQKITDIVKLLRGDMRFYQGELRYNGIKLFVNAYWKEDIIMIEVSYLGEGNEKS